MLISLPADVDVVHIGSLLLVGSNRNRWGNRRLGHLLHLDAPLILRFLEAGQSELRLAIGHHHIHSIFAEYPMYFGNHLIRIGSWVLATLNQMNSTNTESRVALSTTASKEASGKSIALTSMSRNLKFSPFSLYFSFMAFTQTFEMSILVIVLYPSSYIS